MKGIVRSIIEVVLISDWDISIDIIIISMYYYYNLIYATNQ